MANILYICDGSAGHHDALTGILDRLDVQVKTTDSCGQAGEMIDSHAISLVILSRSVLTSRKTAPRFPLPGTVPMLIWYPEERQPQKVLVLPSCEMLDHLHPPLTEEIVKTKIDFLHKVHMQALELQCARKENTRLQDTIADLHKSLDGHNSFLDLMSRRDGLTGLFNRRHFNTVIRECFDSALASGTELSLILLNIDYFGEINKSCGQDFGDFVLNELSARITDRSGSEDICFRLSGEEFAILMPEAPAEAALAKAEKLRDSCDKKAFDNGNLIRNITISAGVASLKTHRPQSHEELINMADQALFLAKVDGRNHCMLYSPVESGDTDAAQQNFRVLQESITRILCKTKTSTVRSLQLLAQGILDDKAREQISTTVNYAELLTQHMQFPPKLVDTFKNATILLSAFRYLLHNEMISKEGTLSADEWHIISDFPYKISQLAELFDYFKEERTILIHHGERFDGSGYPEGLQHDEIPLSARIFTLVNAFAAMNCDRPYRQKLAPEEILTEFSANAATQFDPLLVMKLIDVIEEKGILDISREQLESARKTIKSQLPSTSC